MVDAEVDIRSFRPDDWPGVQALIGEHLEAGHPILREKLFFWQFRGFGPLSAYQPFKILVVDDQVKGLRGAMGVLFQIPQEGGGVRIAPGGFLAMWLVAPEVRGTGMGGRLLDAVQQTCGSCAGLGSNQLSVPIYRKIGWSSLDALHQWFRPLEATGFLELAFGEWNRDEVERSSHLAAPNEVLPPTPPDPGALERLWRASGAAAGLFAIHRTEEYWRWRYLEHPEFEYLFFGDPDTEGVVVGRIEECRPSGAHGPVRSVLRVIEVVPRTIGTWESKPDPAMAVVLRGVLAWARERGCCAADYRNATRRLSRLLLDSGFSEHLEERPDALGRGFAGLLNPFRCEPEPINAHWWIDRRPDDVASLGRDDIYFVKSDGDLDRPNDRPNL